MNPLNTGVNGDNSHILKNRKNSKLLFEKITKNTTQSSTFQLQDMKFSSKLKQKCGHGNEKCRLTLTRA